MNKRAARLQFRLSTLLAIVLLAGLAMGFVQAWQQGTATGPSESARIAWKMVAMRAAKPTYHGSNTQDPFLLLGLVTAAFTASLLRRRLRGRRIPTP